MNMSIQITVPLKSYFLKIPAGKVILLKEKKQKPID